jgi:hypothetical protein
VNHEVHVSNLVIESNRFGGWEACAGFEKFFGNNFIGSLEFVGNGNWQVVILLNLEVSNLKVW